MKITVVSISGCKFRKLLLVRVQYFLIFCFFKLCMHILEVFNFLLSEPPFKK